MRSAHFVWAIAGGFLVGVFLRSWFSLGLYFVAFVVLLAFTALFFVRSRRSALIIVCALFALSLGVVRMHSAVQPGEIALTAHTDEQVTILGRVFEIPDVREDSTRVYVKADTLITKYEKVRVHSGVVVVAPAHADVVYGDRVLAYGTLRLPERFDTAMGRQFAYPEYLAAHGVSYQMTGATIERRGGEWSGNYIKAAALTVREVFLRGLQEVMPEPEAGLASGITVGDKRALGDEIANEFRIASLSHIVVFSGYHVSVAGDAVRALVAWPSWTMLEPY